MSDKEQAIVLGISPSGVGQRLARVRQRLGAGSTREAIRLLDKYENQDCRKTTCGPETLVDSPITGTFKPSEHDTNGAGDRLRDSVIPARFLAPSQSQLEALAGKEKSHGDLTIPQRLLWICVGAIALVIAGFLLLAAFESLSRTLSGS
ncbi:hypothetical protein KY084_15270 [Stakelama sp. CBK3Z-3]|uniref:HTH luxR-type domain-containing protein n=2 Tax=Stakelama flava TaxID=2860338 RepID=A0ABS6XS22_9SPHN|nr:hypothetical protein [Stakelama flava]MBW4332220.1 hypothetical protein [Stakelama flava]